MRKMALVLMLTLEAPLALGMTAGELHELCNKSSTEGLCEFYIHGVIDNTMTDVLNICFPKNANHGQGLAIAKKFIANTPEMWHEPAVKSISIALMKSFACKK